MVDFCIFALIHHGIVEEPDSLLEVPLHHHDHPDSSLRPFDILSDLPQNSKTGLRKLLHQGSKFSACSVMIDWFTLDKSSHGQASKKEVGHILHLGED